MRLVIGLSAMAVLAGCLPPATPLNVTVAQEVAFYGFDVDPADLTSKEAAVLYLTLADASNEGYLKTRRALGAHLADMVPSQ
ncbi:hypothetical protein [Palleronia abyssalis]|uniref:Uncharacterized protein n=1 Tax=Palleronia abyssalis TaxID=1501240 RepID=A0A2R8BTT7_9RHOB|nr:hypothetical protein [Palleronia abyssalis]SPJ23545.1 hypothetical protein PAA8504_01357 [Palleronia abyssalis]